MSGENPVVSGESPEESVQASNPREISRRRFMGWMAGIINTVVGLAFVGPAVVFVAGPLLRKSKTQAWIPVADLRDIAEGAPRLVSYTEEVKDGYMTSEQSNSVYLMQTGNTVLALDPTCPHLGCHVQFQSSRNEFVCPCHGGVFDLTGHHLAGPPPTGLTQLTTRVQDGRIEINKAEKHVIQ